MKSNKENDKVTVNYIGNCVNWVKTLTRKGNNNLLYFLVEPKIDQVTTST